MRKAFTMIELVFVIAVIGILASIAVPKFAATRNDAVITSAKATIASVRAALSTERQLRVLRGDFTVIKSLNAGGGAFSTFSADSAGKKNSVLEGTIPLCETGKSGCWSNVANGEGTTASPSVYTYKMPDDGATVDFKLADGHFKCDESDENCKKLTQ